MNKRAAVIPSTDKTLVIKFGGTSVATIEAMGQSIKIIEDCYAKWPRLIVVTSALAGVTNLLLDSAAKASQGDTQHLTHNGEELIQRHSTIIETLVENLALQQQARQEIRHLVIEFRNFCEAIAVLGEATPRAMDAVSGLGERMSVRVLTAALESRGVPSQMVEGTHLIETDDLFQAAHPDMEASSRKIRQVLEPLLAHGCIPVVTGFIGATPQGATTTLGRSGSDYSAAIIGAALPATEVWIYTDVNGVMTSDPRLVPDAITIPVLAASEVTELAYYGARVLHPKTIRPCTDAGIALRVLNTFNPTHPGTLVVPDKDAKDNCLVKAVTALRKLQLITIEGRGIANLADIAARTFSTIARIGASLPMIAQASSEQSLCFAVPMDIAPRIIQALKSTFELELARHDLDEIWSTDQVAILTVIGRGMNQTAGIAGQIFMALGKNDINILSITHGSSRYSFSLVIEARDYERTLQAIHEFILSQPAIHALEEYAYA